MTIKMLRYRFPFDYELTPTEIDKGTSWLASKLKNIGNETLGDLDIQLYALDTHSLTVYGTWAFGAGF